MKLPINRPALTRRNIIVGLVFVAILYLFFTVIIVKNKASNQKEFIPGIAVISNGESLNSSLGDALQYFSLTEDLDVFANKALGSSRTGEHHTNTVSIKGKVEKNGETITFDANYTKQKVLVHVQVKQLNNSRLTTSITGAKDNSNIDSQLPSNSKKNKFIATLPVINSSYGIYYYKDTQKISVEVTGEYSAAKKQAILETLRTALGKDNLTEDDYDLYYSPDFEAGSSALIKETSRDL